MENLNYRVLLFYKYVEVENPEAVVKEHLKYCKDLGILGRILISEEGINGTLSGTIEQTDKYMDDMNHHPLFNDIWYKIDMVPSNTFKKMHVRNKNELVNFSLEDDINPKEITGNRLNPEEWMEAMNNPNTVIIDARNDYEYELGHFRGAIKPEIKTFRELPNWIRENKEQFEGKKILTYCTGGVRCEKFSGWLKREGFDDVNQLNGGIHTYGTNEETKGKMWDGKMYVFDSRIAVDINQVDKQVVGRDHFTGEPCERYINCGNPECNKQILVLEDNEERYMGSCSDECRIHPRNRWVLARNISKEDVIKRNVEINLKH